jgi:branched-chain amino acid transport system substrate-binding protein
MCRGSLDLTCEVEEENMSLPAKWALGCVLAASAVSATGCGGGSGDSVAQGPAEVTIGTLQPLSGKVASLGVDTLHGVELAVEVINGAHPEIDLPLAAGTGLPGLQGARIRLVKADTQGVPEKGGSEVDRLVTSEKVVAIVGAVQSALTLTASERAERLQVPFVTELSTARGLTRRGLKWFFRTTPDDGMFGALFFEFLAAQREKGHPVERAAIIHTNDEFGTQAADVTKDNAAEAGVQIVADVEYDLAATDLTSQVQKVRAAKPDVVFVAGFANDGILLLKTMQRLRFVPGALLAYGGGFTDPAFLKGVGAEADGVMTRSAWALELARERPAAKAVAELFQQRYGQQMTENSARGFSALLALAQAIDAAGSTEPERIRAALQELDVPGEQTIMPWQGINFDDTGQNVKAGGLVEQLTDGEYKVVYPFDEASTKLRWPLGDGVQ